MKLTRKTLKEMIKEELDAVLNEQEEESSEEEESESEEDEK